MFSNGIDLQHVSIKAGPQPELMYQNLKRFPINSSFGNICLLRPCLSSTINSPLGEQDRESCLPSCNHSIGLFGQQTTKREGWANGSSLSALFCALFGHIMLHRMVLAFWEGGCLVCPPPRR